VILVHLNSFILFWTVGWDAVADTVQADNSNSSFDFNPGPPLISVDIVDGQTQERKIKFTCA
jgi:hypothetical protein